MSPIWSRGSKLGRLVMCGLLFLSAVLIVGPVGPVGAQTQVVSATPGYVNLGMTVTITATAPAPGSYALVVVKPGGSSSSVPLTFTSAGQSQTSVFGNSSVGFEAAVDQVGTYNVFLEQGSTVVGSTSFYATSKLVITMDMVTGGTCYFINSDARGYKFIPRFYAAYASTGALLSNDTAGVKITYTLPDNTVAEASWDAEASLFRGLVQPGWNYTEVGSWTPTVTASDAYGNTGTLAYSGVPFLITPATLATTLQLKDMKTSVPIASVYPGETINVNATITYPGNAEPVRGFVAGLSSAGHGGVVTAIIGYGTFNATTNTFGGSSSSAGGVLGTVKLTNTNATTGTWTGQLTVPSSLQFLPAGTSVAVAITSADDANPPNMGLEVMNLELTAAPQTSTTSATSTVTTPPTTTVTSVASSGASQTTTLTSTQTVSQVTQAVPTLAYAGMIILLIVGLAIGLVVRMPKR